MVKNLNSKPLLSGTLAKATGVSPDTIRHYERVGVLPRASRTESGYRLYPASAAERVLVVRRALHIGFTLAELAEVLKSRDAGGVPCHRVYKLAQEKLTDITANIESLRQTQRDLRKMLDDWEHRMGQTVPGQRSNLLHSLTGNADAPARKANQFRKGRL
jgi:MerR family transcriptional regulator, copper efflux regulator